MDTVKKKYINRLFVWILEPSSPIEFEKNHLFERRRYAMESLKRASDIYAHAERNSPPKDGQILAYE